MRPHRAWYKDSLYWYIRSLYQSNDSLYWYICSLYWGSGRVETSPARDHEPAESTAVGASRRLWSVAGSLSANRTGGGLPRLRRSAARGFGEGCGEGLDLLYGSVVPRFDQLAAGRAIFRCRPKRMPPN